MIVGCRDCGMLFWVVEIGGSELERKLDKEKGVRGN